MGASISYWTTHPVGPALKAALTAKAGELDRHWWNEPLCFFDWKGKEKHLAGDTKPFGSLRKMRSGEAVDLSASIEGLELDCFMAYRDMKFICEQLAQWSATHGLTFEVMVGGSAVGHISSGTLADALTELLASGGVPFGKTWGADEVADARREQEIWSQYPEAA